MKDDKGHGILREQLRLFNLKELSRRTGIKWHVLRDFRSGKCHTLDSVAGKLIKAEMDNLK